jgi:hypothetical protein
MGGGNNRPPMFPFRFVWEVCRLRPEENTQRREVPGAAGHGGWHRGIRVILNQWLHASMMNYNAVHRFGSNRSALVLGAAPKNEDTKLCTSMAPTRRDCSSSSRASSSRPLRARTDTCRDVLARALRQRPLAALRQDPRRPSGHGLRRVLQGSVVVEAGHLFGRRAVRSIKMDYMPSTWRSRSCPIFRGGVWAQPPQQTPRPPAQGLKLNAFMGTHG